MDWEEIIDVSIGWGDADKTVDEMLAEIRSGWRIIDTFGDDETDEVPS